MKFRSSEQKRLYMESQKNWDSIVEKHTSVKKFATKKVKEKPWVYSLSSPRDTPAIESRVTMGGSTAAKSTPRYTGDLMTGVGTMHKSNMVPIFNSDQAKEIASMRR